MSVERKTLIAHADNATSATYLLKCFRLNSVEQEAAIN